VWERGLHPVISEQELAMLEEWKESHQKVTPKPNPKGFSFHLLTISFWEGDAGITIGEIETWDWVGAMFEIWFNNAGGPHFDLLYLSYIKKRFFMDSDDPN
jgi:hypothetical protein